MDDLAYERYLDRRAVHFGFALIVTGVLYFVLAVAFPAIPDLPDDPVWMIRLGDVIDTCVSFLFVLEGARRVKIGKAPPPDSGLLLEEPEEGWSFW